MPSLQYGFMYGLIDHAHKCLVNSSLTDVEKQKPRDPILESHVRCKGGPSACVRTLSPWSTVLLEKLHVVDLFRFIWDYYHIEISCEMNSVPESVESSVQTRVEDICDPCKIRGFHCGH
jgi:hypothetical protein